MSQEQETILTLQDRIKTLELDVQYELHLRTKLEEKLSKLKQKIKNEYNIDINIEDINDNNLG